MEDLMAAAATSTPILVARSKTHALAFLRNDSALCSWLFWRRREPLSLPVSAITSERTGSSILFGWSGLVCRSYFGNFRTASHLFREIPSHLFL